MYFPEKQNVITQVCGQYVLRLKKKNNVLKIYSIQQIKNSVDEHIEDAVVKGGKIVCGGSRHSLGGSFFEPTLLVDANQEMKVASEETFGPLAPVF